MFCPKCGAQIEDNSVYCAKCGEKLSEQQGTNTVVVVQNSVNSKSLFNTAFILNIIAFALPVIIMLIFNILAKSSNEQSGSSDVTVSLEYADALNVSMIEIVLIVGVLVFLLGIVIFILKNTNKIKLLNILSMIYLSVAIIDLLACFIVLFVAIIGTCGMGIICIVPGILQIIAGTKYVKAASNLKKQNV